MKNPLVMVIIVVFLFVSSIYFYTNKQNKISDQVIPEQVQPTEFPTPTFGVADENTLRVGGSSFSDPKGHYTFLYPSDYVLDTSDELHPRIYKRGPSERSQSEMTDGALVVFESIDLQGKTLEQFVDARIQESTVNGMSELIEPKKSTTINSYPAFTYLTRGLGSFNNLVIQKDAKSNQALYITFLVADPQNVGYQQEVDAMLSTLQLLK